MGIQITRDHCQSIIDHLREKNDWQLIVDEDLFLDMVQAEAMLRLQETNTQLLDKIIEDAVVNRYCHLWHWACAQTNTPIQARAIAELQKLVYPRILLIVGDEHVTEDVSQQVIVNLWKKLEQIKDPGRFIKWVTVSAVRAAKKRVLSDNTQRLKQATHDDELFRAKIQETLSRHEPQMRDEIITELTIAIRSCLRSKKQQEAIIRSFFGDKEHTTIAEELGTTPANLSVLKSKALTRLRKCKRFIDLLKDLTQN